MKTGDLVRFTKTNHVGVIVAIKKATEYTIVEVHHEVVTIRNPATFTMSNLKRIAKVVSESR